MFSLLGIGSDGHTASLFPGTDFMGEAIVHYGGLGPEGKKRISLSKNFLLTVKDTYLICNTIEKLQAVEKSKSVDLPISPFVTNTDSILLVPDSL